MSFFRDSPDTILYKSVSPVFASKLYSYSDSVVSEGASVEGSVGASVEGSVGASVDSSVGASVDSSVGASVEASVDSSDVSPPEVASS